LRIEYSLSRGDALAGARLQINWVAMLLFMSAGLFVITALFTIWSEPPPLLLGWVARLALGALAFGVAMTLAFWFVLFPVIIARLYRQNSEMFQGLILIADTDSFTMRGSRSTATFPWSEIREFKENRHVFLLCKSKSMYFTIPKQGLPDETIDAFRGLVRERLKRPG
jgi:hypothetical protein